MEKLIDILKDYIETTPKDIQDKDWKEIEHLNKFGTDVISYNDRLKKKILLNRLCRFYYIHLPSSRTAQFTNISLKYSHLIRNIKLSNKREIEIIEKILNKTIKFLNHVWK